MRDSVRLWGQVLANFVIPQLPKMPTKDRKLAAVGMTRMLTQSEYTLRDASTWYVTSSTHFNPPPLITPQYRTTGFTSLVKLFQEPQYLTKSSEADDAAGFTQIDYEEQTAGYQAAYSRLSASEETVKDPVAYVRDPRDFLGQKLIELAGREAGMKEKIRGMLGGADPALVGPFVQGLVGSGYAFV